MYVLLLDSGPSMLQTIWKVVLFKHCADRSMDNSLYQIINPSRRLQLKDFGRKSWQTFLGEYINIV